MAGQLTGQELVNLKNRIVGVFNVTNWRELGTLTGAYELVTNHPRLLRSLSFGDDDYEGHVLDVIRRIVAAGADNYRILMAYVQQTCPPVDDVVFSPNGAVVTFKRHRDYRMIRELGRGACGQTVRLHDDLIEEDFVCKKYQPQDESAREEYFAAFRREIKLLHRLLHPNVVRVFSYYLYPERFTGFIFMEFIDGTDIQDFLGQHPDKADELFLQAISGFEYLETAGVLHRDIRPRNLMVSDDGVLKIIDLGFGKRIADSADFEKSISLNWWCEPPADFANARYDFTTEVYFVGKLFERIIEDSEVAQFHFREPLRRMCERNPEKRIESFSLIHRSIRSNQFSETRFKSNELKAYRAFAGKLCDFISKIEDGAKYLNDVDRVKRNLSDAHRSFMLEEFVPDPSKVVRCFFDGTYYYKRNFRFPVADVAQFLEVLRSCSAENATIILANLHTKLDAIERIVRAEDVPF